jgi:hypothetical protein
MADPKQRERESRESAENKFVEERDEQRENVAEHADELRRMPDPEPEPDD